MIDSDGSNPRPFPNQQDLTASFYPSWYQDLQSIVVLEAMSPTFATLYQDFATGSNPPVLLTPSSGFCAGRPSVNPAGTAVAFVARAPLANGPDVDPQPVTPPDIFASHGEWSRQQNLIVFDNAGKGQGIGTIAVPPMFQMTAV